MKDDELVSKEPRQDKERNISRTVSFAALALLFVGIEIRFVLDVVHLIRVHTDRNYLTSAITFQLVFIMSIFYLNRCWRKLGTGPGASSERGNVLKDVFMTILCLLFSLMFFSSVAADWARTHP